MNDSVNNMNIASENSSRPKDNQGSNGSSLSIGFDCFVIMIVVTYGLFGISCVFSTFLYHCIAVKTLLVVSFSGTCYWTYDFLKNRKTNPPKSGILPRKFRIFLFVLLFIMAVLHNYAAYSDIQRLKEDVPILSDASIRYIFDWQELIQSGNERYIVATLKKEKFLAYIDKSEPVNPNHKIFDKYNYLYLNISAKSYEGYRISNQYEPYYLLFNPAQENRIKFYIIKPFP